MVIVFIVFVCFCVWLFKFNTKYKNKIMSFLWLGLVFYILSFIVINNVSNIPFIPREVLIRYDTIAPVIHNDLNDNEVIYSYNYDDYCHYYIRSSDEIKGKLIFDEVKIQLDKVTFELDDNEYPISMITYSDFVPFWKFIIGESKPIILECTINK